MNDQKNEPGNLKKDNRAHFAISVRKSIIDSHYFFSTFLTVVVAPPSNVRFTGALVFHAPRVKSGISTVLDFLDTDLSLNGMIELHAAASYTSWSSGRPLRKQSINLQSIIKSIPP